MGDNSHDEPDESPKGEGTSGHLKTLIPKYDEEKHGRYVEYLITALSDRKDVVRNVAVTGTYGAGKSSVLEGFRGRVEKEAALKGKVITLSLSSLGSTPPGGAKSGDDPAISNEIAKELVKQLLYVPDPKDVPASRYKRVQPPNARKAGLVIGTVVVTALTWLSLLGWLPDSLTWNKTRGGSHWLLEAGRLLVIWALTIAVLSAVGFAAQLFFRRYVLASLSAGGTALSFSEKSDNYFDDFLDEIVYFFQATGKTVVLFEDLDRFENPSIFEELRELNTFLNGAAQIDGPVQFVYAIKDSVFEAIGGREQNGKADENEAYAEMERSNRTKFFDLIIPIVPFITHRNSRDLMTQRLEEVQMILGDRAEVSRPLVRIVGRHFTDMRAIHNLCNEYQVFAQALLIDKGGIPDLKPDPLFAMLAYKSLNLSDFEKILRGKSKLDDVYTDSRAFIDQAILERESRLRENAVSPALEARRVQSSSDLAERLKALFEVFFRRLGAGTTAAQVKVDGTPFNASVLDSPDFWDKLTQATDDLEVTPTGGRAAQVISLTSIDRILQYSKSWERPATQAESDQQLLREEVSFLKTADMSDLVSRSDISATVPADDSENKPQTFSQRFHNHPVSEIGRELIAAGYIDRHFTLYVGEFHDTTLPAAAMTYVHRHVERATNDARYQFGGDDTVRALLDEVGAENLGVGAYNLEIVNYLLGMTHPLQDALAKEFGREGDEAQAFLGIYLNEGAHPEMLVQLMSRTDRRILTRITNRDDLSADLKVRLIDAVLRFGAAGADLETNDELSDLLKTGYKRMGAFTEPQSPASRRLVVDMLDQPLPDLEDLDPALREEVVLADLYTLTAPNLQSARQTIRLAALPVGDAVYARCLRDLDAYLDLARTHPADAVTQDASESRSLIARLAGEHEINWTEGDTAFDVVSTLTPPTNFVSAFRDFPEVFWQPLAANGRVPLTLENVWDYLTDGEVQRTIDTAFAEWVAGRNAIYVSEPHEGRDSADRDPIDTRHLAEQLLNAHDVLPSAEQRVKLAQSLKLDEGVEPELVEPQDGPLLALLIRAELFASEEGALRRFLHCDWNTIAEAAPHLKDPSALTRTITGDDFPVERLPEVLKSQLPKSILVDLLASLPTQVAEDEATAAAAFDAAADVAIKLLADEEDGPPEVPHWLTVELLEGILGNVADSGIGMVLLPRLATTASIEELRHLLRKMGGKYAALADPGGKAILDKSEITKQFAAFLYQRRLLISTGRSTYFMKMRGQFELTASSR